MKTGMNLLLWTTHVTAEHFPILGKLVLLSLPPMLFSAFRAASAAMRLEAFRRAQKRPERVRRADAPRLILHRACVARFAKAGLRSRQCRERLVAGWS